MSLHFDVRYFRITLHQLSKCVTKALRSCKNNLRRISENITPVNTVTDLCIQECHRGKITTRTSVKSNHYSTQCRISSNIATKETTRANFQAEHILFKMGSQSSIDAHSLLTFNKTMSIARKNTSRPQQYCYIPYKPRSSDNKALKFGHRNESTASDADRQHLVILIHLLGLT